MADLNKINVGDILVSRWGYSMLLYDFFMVVGKTAKTLKLVELAKEEEAAEGFLRVKVKPKRGSNGLPMAQACKILTRRPDKHGHFHGTLDSQDLWLDSFYKENQEYIEDHAD